MLLKLVTAEKNYIIDAETKAQALNWYLAKQPVVVDKNVGAADLIELAKNGGSILILGKGGVVIDPVLETPTETTAESSADSPSTQVVESAAESTVTPAVEAEADQVVEAATETVADPVVETVAETKSTGKRNRR